jgi:hypothetical protein
VPPIYQPEVAARLIYHAAHHPERREWYASWSVLKAIFGNKIAPSYADRYLAQNGYESQQYDGRKDPNRPDNLFQPLAGDHGAHGAFDCRAKTWSAEAWAEEHAGTLATVLLGLGIAGTAFAVRRLSSAR